MLTEHIWLRLIYICFYRICNVNIKNYTLLQMQFALLAIHPFDSIYLLEFWK